MSLDFIPRQDELEIKAEPKPRRGAKLLDHRDKTDKEKAHEKKLMIACLRLDEHKCRIPRCEYASRKLPIDPCHKVHRGMGGNPKGDRTTLPTLIALCRCHHDDYDHGRVEIDELTPQGFRGRCDYYAVNVETGERTHIGSDKVIGVSSTRSVR